VRLILYSKRIICKNDYYKIALPSAVSKQEGKAIYRRSLHGQVVK
jgi:hypothetical protein